MKTHCLKVILPLVFFFFWRLLSYVCIHYQ